jgi:uncharacterized surface protein with fasciclin (FAS1) repeats
MKKTPVLLLASLATIFGCKQQSQDATTTAGTTAKTEITGQSNVEDDSSSPNIIKVASGSKDHTTLVAAVKAADLVNALSNTGPFTVFAPTNAAFAKLPAGTVDDLLKPENKEKLVDILGYHTYVGVLKTDYMQDGQQFEEVNGKKVTITKKDGKVFVNGSEIITSIPTSNGIIHVINDVLSPI